MLDTRPDVTGSTPVTKIIGMLAVAALAARAPSILLTIAATLRATSSAANFGNCSGRPSAQRDSIVTLSVGWPDSRRPNNRNGQQERGQLMSALGQKQTFRPRNVMSALPQKADIAGRDRHVG